MHYLAFYNIRIKEIQTGKYLNLDSYSPGKDVIKDLHQYAKSKLNSPQNHMKKSTAGFLSYNVTEYKSSKLALKERYTYGILETGESGKASRLLDTTKVGTASDPVAYNKKVADAMMQPFTFLLYAPANLNRGVLCLQKNGTAGIKGYFLDTYINHFKQSNPGLDMELSRISPAKAMEHILKSGLVKNFRFIRKDVPSDITDRLKKYDADAEPEEMELIIKAKRFGSLLGSGVLSRLLKHNAPDFKSIVEFPDVEFDTIKVDVQIGSKTRKIDLGKLGSIITNVDISDEVKYDSTGYPISDTVRDIAIDIATSMV
ncbi:hypothetical protein [Chromobacterium paludis]|uniref:Uncharacterized protein n=1 Tax=Chromobacterium paludis TaxID=2605945 RepID=A0A5C1DIC3_9NEIS|nr:hypothetical protein [Chromobacterium paludis]QEL56460.1 hypothetical protein FYK34_13260 [Chromobacterium paludis]